MKEFLAAARELEGIGVGSLAALQVAGSSPGLPSHAFIKKLPFTARDTLRSHPNLCTPELYTAKFSQKSSLPQQWQDRLVSMGLVAKVLFC